MLSTTLGPSANQTEHGGTHGLNRAWAAQEGEENSNEGGVAGSFFLDSPVKLAFQPVNSLPRFRDSKSGVAFDQRWWCFFLDVGDLCVVFLFLVVS